MPRKITLAKYSGFCFGVKRALDIAMLQNDASTFGPLIHNPQVIKVLEDKGIDSIDSLSQLKKSRLIIRAHGVPASFIEKAISKGITVIDATCPYVKKVHDIAKAREEEGYKVIVVGDPDHPEVKGITGDLKDPIILSSPDEVKDKITKPVKQIVVVSQTTQSYENFAGIVKELMPLCRKIIVRNTICTSTQQRQDAAKKLAEISDIMIIIGGKNSANTIRLYELCKAITLSYHIETKAELDESWFDGKHDVGITAGASTPDWIITEVIDEIKIYR